MRQRGRGEQGQATVEFALILPLLLLVIFGLIDVSRAVWQENTLAFAAREATRYAIVHGSASITPVPACATAEGVETADWCTNDVITQVVERNAIGVPNITVQVRYAQFNNDRGSTVEVVASAPFVPLPSQYLLDGALSVTLRGGSKLVIQR